MNKYKYARNTIDIIEKQLMNLVITLPNNESFESWICGFNDCLTRVRNILKERRDILLMFESKKVGRPKLPDEDRKSKTLKVRVTEDEKKQIEKAAEEENLTTTEYIRRKLWETM